MKEEINYKYNRGGYLKGSGEHRGDCVPRAISIATGLPYKKVYDELNKRTQEWWLNSSTKETRHRKPDRYKVHFGTYKKVYKPYLEELGWTWIPTMGIGTGCKVHLKASELPKGRIICKLSRHLVAVIDGVMNDIYNSSRDGNRCVYGYFAKL